MKFLFPSLLIFSNIALFLSLGFGAMTPAVFCLAIIFLMLASMMLEILPAEVATGAALLSMLLGNSIADKPFLVNAHNNPDETTALIGFSNPAVITVAALFIVASAVRKTTFFKNLAPVLLGHERGPRKAIFRMALPLVGFSAFLNNTPIVAMFLPVVRDWCLKQRIAPSKLLIPLSYLTCFGGLCTLIGTSTNLIIVGLMAAQGIEAFGFFDFAWIGLPAAVIGVLYLAFIGLKILPSRLDTMLNTTTTIKKYLIEMTIGDESDMAGVSVGESGLRDLDDVFLVAIRRGEFVRSPVKREQMLEKGDRLVFSGSRDKILELTKVSDLYLPEQCQEISLGQYSELLEVVVSPTSPLRGKTIEDVWFNRKYDASVLALHRHGEDIIHNFTKMPLQTGDTLLLLAGFGFRRIWQDSTDFLLVSSPLEKTEVVQEKGVSSGFVLSVLALMVVLPIMGLISITLSATAAAVILGLYTNTSKGRNLFAAVEWNVIIVVACAFGLSEVLKSSGASKLLVDFFLSFTQGYSPLLSLIALYILTNILTEVITNNAAAALCFPLAWQLHESLGVTPQALLMTVAVAASASFATPIGYQTNMLVAGPGNYRFSDYLKVGLPLNALYLVLTIIIAPIIWPF